MTFPVFVLLLAQHALFSVADTTLPLPHQPALLRAEAAETPNMSVATATSEQESIQPAPDARPARLSIPSIGLDSPIIPMGMDAKGDLAVPNGDTNNVGWWAQGTVPGEMGTAVLDAHVFAAFSELHHLTPGAEIIVTTKDGAQLRFTVQEMHTYALSELTPDMLFNRAGARGLNLITCAGSLTADRSTYDHRLVVYATLTE